SGGSYSREELMNIRATTPVDLFPSFLASTTDLLVILIKEARNKVKSRRRGKRSAPHLSDTPPPTPLTIKEEEVNRLFKRLNTHKATGPDSPSPSLLKHCANQLSPVFTDIFNTSLETCHVPACFKTSAIVPVPKKTKITGLNDYRPVALTSVVMKSFERLVLSYLKDITDPLLDPLQFAYRANRCVDDAVNMALHFILQHLDSPGSYARILFVDFSSAFNMIVPALLRDKLFQLNVPDSMCSWITEFLTDRRQFVRLGTDVSDLQHISTGSPQGCVLSSLLFSLYTNSCTSGHQSVKLLKFADDTILIGLISDGDESAYRDSGDDSGLQEGPSPPPPVILCDSPVTSVESFDFLGTTITKEFKWEQNIRSLTKKAQQRMYFLRQLKKFLLPVKMLVNFYTAIIEPILTSSITVWFAAATARDKAKLQRVIHSAEKVIGCSVPSLQELYVSRSQRRAAKIAADPSHPGNELFRSLPSGKIRSIWSIRTRTSCHKNSFFPTAVSLLYTRPPRHMDTRYNGVGVYDRQTLLELGNHAPANMHDELRKSLRHLGLLRRPGPESSASPDASGWERSRRKRWKWKRGKRAGVRARLKTNPSWPALPSILLSNVCSLDNKLDYIRLQQTTWRDYRDFVFTGSWLSDRVPDATIQLDGLTMFRADRNTALCGKTHGGGLCVYINAEWCKNSVLVSSFCSSLVEFVTVRCRPFYLPREFTTVFIVGVYIPPSANAKEALCELYRAISKLQNAHPDGLFIIAVHFNHANLKSVLPKFHQHVDFATREVIALDLVYTNIPGAYHEEPRSHLGYSDHISVMLIPAYRPLVRHSKPVLKQSQKEPALLFRTVLSALTGTCSGRLQPKAIPQIWRNIRHQ
ncbi:hypothetical protein QTP86_017474, partial [Hemibagrus guttatus]